MQRHTLALTTILTLLATPVLAADLLGTRGVISELHVNSVNSDSYLQHHGRVVITAEGRASEYRWGGVACSNKTLTESQVTMLQRALESVTTIEPRFQAGQGTNRCIVGFGLVTP